MPKPNFLPFVLFLTFIHIHSKNPENFLPVRDNPGKKNSFLFFILVNVTFFPAKIKEMKVFSEIKHA